MPDEPAAATPAPPPPAGGAGPTPAGGGSAAAPPALPKPRPEGEPEGMVTARELIEEALAKLVDDYVVQGGSYVLGFRSARVWIVPASLESGMTVIRVFAITNMEVPVTAELSSYLVSKNLDFICGSFALDTEHGAVWFNHNLLGPFAVPEEVEATIVMIAETADRFDDEIKSRFGGRLYVESSDETIPPPSTPGYL